MAELRIFPLDSSGLCRRRRPRTKQNVRSIEPRLWSKAIHLNICSRGAGHRHEAISLVWSIPSITALTQNYSSSHTQRAILLFPSSLACERKWAQSLFPSVDISMQGGTATITQSISFPWTIGLSPSNYYQAPTSDPLIATRPISYTQLAAACMPNLRLKGMLPPTKHVFRKKYWLLQEK